MENHVGLHANYRSAPKGMVQFPFSKLGGLGKNKFQPWINEKSFLVLHHQYIGYNSLHNTPQNKLIWVKLHNLPIELWMKQVMMDIGNAIGKFVYVDPHCLGAQDKRVAQISIQKEYHGGFLDHINLFQGDTHLSRRLEFWGVPFWCSQCDHTGICWHNALTG